MKIHNFKIENLALHNVDCFDFMRPIKTRRFDMVLTSPPYNMNLRCGGGNQSDTYIPRNDASHVSTKYATGGDNLSMPDYEKLLKKTFRECLRIADLSFVNLQMVTGNKPALFRTMGHFADNIKEFIIWDKNHGVPAMGDGVLNSRFEFIIVLSNSAMRRSFTPHYFERGKLDNLWTVNREQSKDATHGAVFPRALAKKIIENFCPAGGSVFDPFAGTGTTAIACHETGRAFTGTEKDGDYFTAACERMTMETAQGDLFI